MCSYDGARTVGETLTGFRNLGYSNRPVIFFSDGCIDATIKSCDSTISA